MLFQAEFRFTLNTSRWNARDFQAGAISANGRPRGRALKTHRYRAGAANLAGGPGNGFRVAEFEFGNAREPNSKRDFHLQSRKV